MLTVVRDARQQIQAACDWYLVNEVGWPDVRGAYIWVEQLELSPGGASRQAIRDVMADIAWLVPQARGAYWVRRDRTWQRVHAYPRARLLQFVSSERKEVSV